MIHHRPRFVVAVVDDDRSVLESLDELLGSAGHDARLFDSGSALLESRMLTRIDCLISDIDLPGIHGFELLGRVRAARPELPVILITGHPDLANRSPPIGAEQCRLFKKPFDGQELLRAISAAQGLPLE